MQRREFLGAAAASIFAPKFSRWFRQGSGLVVPASSPFEAYMEAALPEFDAAIARAMRECYADPIINNYLSDCEVARSILHALPQPTGGRYITMQRIYP